MRRALVPLVVIAALLPPAVARADEHSIIRSPGDHPPYFFEAEPHLLVGYSGPFDSDGNFGVGFRGTFHIANGFVPSINDSVGVGVGFDLATNGHVLIPIVMQWNFYLSREWSVFGEPGLAVRYQSVPGARNVNVDPQLYVGGRWHFSDQMTLTMRLGYPTFSVGVSFM